MKPSDLLNAMSEIDEDLIRRSGQKKRRFSWKPILAMAACLTLVLGIGALLLRGTNSRDSLRVAIFYTGSDEAQASYEQAAAEALSAYYGKYDLEYSRYKDPSEGSRAEEISKAVAEGSELVLLDGRQEGPTLLTVAAQHPDTTFLALGVSEAELGQDLPKNIVCIDYKPEIAGYLAGYTAVKEGYTKLGYYYDLGVDSYFAYGSGYLQGIEAAAKEMGITDKVQIRISSSYILPKDTYCLTEDLNRICSWYSEGTQMVLACGELSCEAAESAAEYCKGDAILVGRPQTAQDSQNILSWSIAQMLDSIQIGEFGQNNTGFMPYYTLNDPDGTWGFQNVSKEEFAALRDSLINGTRPCKAEMVQAEEYSVEVLFS